LSLSEHEQTPLPLNIPLPSLHLSLVFLASLVLCTALTWLMPRVQRSAGMDLPDGARKQHGRAVSRLGGLPIFITLLAGTIYMPFGLLKGAQLVAEWWPLILCQTIVFSVGFADDLKPLGARVKLMGQIGAASLLYTFGFSIEVLTHPTSGDYVNLGWFALPITIVWLVAIPNVINLIDGMDGLAGGFGLFLCLTLGVIGHYSQMPDVVMASAVMTGALAGFLFFNFPPAKIFLGDGGAYLIGFFVASLSLASSHKGTIVGALLVMIVALGIPILDTTFAILRRAVRGLPLFRADAEHIHHRLLLLGFTQGQALLVLYVCCAGLSLIGISILLSRGLSTVVVCSALVIMALVAARYLGYVRGWMSLRQQFRTAMIHRRDLQFTKAYARLLEQESLRAETQEDFTELLERALRRLGYVASPEEGEPSFAVPVGSDWIWTLGSRAAHLDLQLASRHADELSESLSLALERWGPLPGLKLTPRNPASATTVENAPASPASPTLQ